jgi:hypothetical protein
VTNQNEGKTVTTSAPTAGSSRTSLRRLLTVVLILIVACGVWARVATGPVRERADQYRYLAIHGVHENDRVVELGVQDSSLAAESVIVTSSIGVQAFVELEGSRERVTGIGGTIPVVLDLRDPTAVGFGAAPDIIDRSFAGAYLRAAAAPVSLTIIVLLVSGGVLIRRRRRTSNAGS